ESMLSTYSTIRFHPPGSCWWPSGIGRAPEVPGPLKMRLSSPRETRAKPGPALILRWKPKWRGENQTAQPMPRVGEGTTAGFGEKDAGRGLDGCVIAGPPRVDRKRELSWHPRVRTPGRGPAEKTNWVTSA